MRVFRYEHPNTGWGPYCNPYDETTEPELWNEYRHVRYGPGKLDSHNDLETHPTPDWSLDYFMEPEDVCGCTTLDSLIRWFDGLHDVLSSHGFEIVELEVSNSLVIGPDRFGQVVFPREAARRIS